MNMRDTVDYQNKVIVVGVPYDYDITRMVVTEMNLSEGAKASIAIGETIDFSLPVSLTCEEWRCTNELHDYREEMMRRKILTFKLNDTYVGKVDQLSKTISVVVSADSGYHSVERYVYRNGRSYRDSGIRKYSGLYEPRYLHGNLPVRQ